MPHSLRLGTPASNLLLPLLGAALTIAVAYLAVDMGARVSVGLLVGVALFLGTIAAFASVPHLAVAGTVVLFPLVPTLKVFTIAEIGAVKDLVVIAAVIGAAIVMITERRSIDRWIAIPVLLLFGMYVINIGGGHGIAWAQGVRLVGEPLLLLLVGLALPEPRRTLRYALVALIATAVLVAGYGMLQQVVGKFTLVEWGYSFEREVRSFGGGQLRSFGTLDDPFAYAAFLLFGLAAIFFWLRRGPVAWATAAFILVGLGLSFTRTAILLLLAFVGLALARRGFLATAVLAVLAIFIASAAILIGASGTQERSIPVAGTPGAGTSTANVILNGRISAWDAALGDDRTQLLFGRGVGEVGTAATRATYTVAEADTAIEAGEGEAVDSGYLATIADVGFVGLTVLLVLFARLLTLAGVAARQSKDSGWVALALIATLLLDALARSSFTGFPTAFLGLLLVGVALAAAQEKSLPGSPRVPAIRA